MSNFAVNLISKEDGEKPCTSCILVKLDSYPQGCFHLDSCTEREIELTPRASSSMMVPRKRNSLLPKPY